MTMIKKLCVYCGSSTGNRPEYAQAARELAHAMVSMDMGLVYGGASVGVMGKLADAVVKEGGEVIGVIPKGLFVKEVAHTGISELREVDTMHERKAMMAELSDGFIALPGGLGTIEEFFEIWTWAQLGMHQKPCGFLNTGRYYDKLIDFIDHAVSEQFIKEEYRSMVFVEQQPDILLKKFESYRAPEVARWIDRKDI
jgi:uncharacterized protein (TIGR00730 family)